MASLRDIKNRIRSIKSSGKITKAMKMVAAAKLRKAQEEVQHSRPYADKLNNIIARLAQKTYHCPDVSHPLLAKHQQQKKVEVIVLSSDRGLCGAFNANIIKRSSQLLANVRDKYENISVSTIGKKGYEGLVRNNIKIAQHYDANLENITIDNATEISRQLCINYQKNHLNAVWLVYNEFGSALSQKLMVKQMLPIIPVKVKEGETSVDYLYEPNKYEMLDYLLPKALAVKLYQAFLESAASEHGARMTAMDNATRNASDMVEDLTLQYNRARQASITTELVEIISGAQAVG